jgi:prevent-host-death family protein
MSTVGAYEAKTHLPRLLERVAGGETITITKNGKPVAVLVPPGQVPRPDVAAIVAQIRQSRRHVRPDPDGWGVKRLVEHGRRP